MVLPGASDAIILNQRVLTKGPSGDFTAVRFHFPSPDTPSQGPMEIKRVYSCLSFFVTDSQ
jgi:hypothetical protein